MRSLGKNVIARRAAARRGNPGLQRPAFAGLDRVAALAMTILILFLVQITSPGLAVEPQERLDDPALEARARAISAELRCLVCQNQSIDDSNADLAKDLRVLVRERLKAGDTDAQVIGYVTVRYGEFVLLRPRFSWTNLLLWTGPLLIFLTGSVLAWRFIRTQREVSIEPAPLNTDEQAALDGLLAGENGTQGGQHPTAP